MLTTEAPDPQCHSSYRASLKSNIKKKQNVYFADIFIIQGNILQRYIIYAQTLHDMADNSKFFRT